MTESECIGILKYYDKQPWFLSGDQPAAVAFKFAIQALSEVEQYRAIGTVEEFKAIKQWKSDIIESFSKYDVNSVDELMKRFKELTEKAEPKKPFSISETDDNDNALVECPVCHANDEYSVKTIKSGHCWKCGQRLDWE